MKYWRILIVLLFPLVVAVATMSGIYPLAVSLLTVVTTNGDTTASYVINSNMLVAALLVALIASLFLAVTWWTFKPKVAYLGGMWGNTRTAITGGTVTLTEAASPVMRDD